MVLGKNNFKDKQNLKEIPEIIDYSPTEGYFFVFLIDETFEIIEKSLKLFGKVKLRDVLNTDYLFEDNVSLKPDEGLYFKEIAVVYTKLTDDQVIEINTYIRDFMVDTEKLLNINPYVEEYRPESFIETRDWGLNMIGAHECKLTGKGVNVAILDTGFDVDHPDFIKDRVKGTKHFIEDTIQDYNGHGTHCTGIACGYVDQSGLRYGVAYESDIYVAKILNYRGYGTQINLLKGLFWAIKNDCQVISVSAEEDFDEKQKCNYVYERAIQFALSKGCIVVAAAGNNFDKKKEIKNPISSPANCPSAISVTSIDMDEKVSHFSNQAKLEHNQKVDFTAPGGSIYSAWSRQGKPEAVNQFASGTSMATPFVSGVVALLWQAYPSATTLEIINMLRTIPPYKPEPPNEWKVEDVGRGLIKI